MKENATRMLFAAIALPALAAVLAGAANARIPEGAGTDTTSSTVVSEQQAEQTSVALDPAIKAAIQARADDAPLAAQPIVIPYLSQGIGVDPSLFDRLPSRTVTAQKQVARAFPYLSYLGKAQRHGGRVQHKTALPHGIQVGLP